MPYNDELVFQKDFIDILSQYGWEKEIIYNPSEDDLLKNWAKILFSNNKEVDRLNDQPLTPSEMQQIIEQIKALRSPLKLNGFINGKTVSIKRDNPNDKLHFGKEISLKIYDRMEIAAGNSTYQIVSQPKFKTPGLINDRRGDVMLLINGMPVIHIELKRSGVPVSQAAHQIEKYSREGVFRGIYALVQIFVAMNPEDTVYFANPGEDQRFNPNYFFRWADIYNEPIKEWKAFTSKLLSIPMAHQLIGFYTVADNTDGLLKVMRSYQYYAAHAISNKVAKTKWDDKNQLGGYIWHTTGSGKTMTSFKSAQLIATSKDADKVIFLVDRIELGTQSLSEYKNFANDNEDVQATENTNVLVTKLKSGDPANTLIVTSIQKMSRIGEDEEGLKAKDIELMKSKRTVFIVDEAHRSTFGEMLYRIKATFPQAIFFGFTGTPIHDENNKRDVTTADIFGSELHRYSIADGIRDKNILGFDPYKVSTFKDLEIRKAVALHELKAKSEADVIADDKKLERYYEFIQKIPMAGSDQNGRYIKGIEDYVPNSQYDTDTQRLMVVEDIISNWMTLSRNGKFHAIFATNSIKEAIMYYRLFKEKAPKLKVSGLFDPNIDNNPNGEFKENGLIELLEDYNARYGMTYDVGTFQNYKKNVASRLAHKVPYISIHKTPEKQIDLLIVVYQMLTGFDSKWINTLYVDKVLEFENIIQAFSRTNRLFGPEKPFGTVKYYRKPHTMERNIEIAIKSYSGDRPFSLFVPKLKDNVLEMNKIYHEIEALFKTSENVDFTKLPEEESSKAKFAKLFKQLSEALEAAKIQGFHWEDTIEYEMQRDHAIEVTLIETDYLILAQRYKELRTVDSDSERRLSIPYDLEGYLTEINTGLIDTNYMNTKFEKYLIALEIGKQEDIDITLKELHSTFATLTQEEQKYAQVFLNDIYRGEVKITKGKTLKDYITSYQVQAKNDQIKKCAILFGLSEEKLRQLLARKVTMDSINEFGRFEELLRTVNITTARQYFEAIEQKKLSIPQIQIKIDEFLRHFIFEGGFEINLGINTSEDSLFGVSK